MAKKIMLARHESFPLREGWMTKVLNDFPKYGKEIFQKESGIEILGIGANMVKSLKYWVTAGNILSGTYVIVFTDFGKSLLNNDPFMTSDLSWYLFHNYLTSNLEQAPVFYYMFHLFDKETVDKESMETLLVNYLTSNGYTFNQKSLQKDINVFFSTYYRETSTLNPEENNISPLTRFNFFSSSGRSGQYKFVKRSKEPALYLLICFLLANLYSDSFNIDEAYENPQSPAKTFHLTRSLFNEYLGEMNAENLIRIDRTAGLNAAYFTHKMDYNELYKLWNEKGGH